MRKFVAGLIIGVVIAMGLPVSASDAPAAPPVEESAPIKLVVNGQEITLPDAQPVVIDNRVMVPLMAFSQVAGFNATWVEETRTVLVTTPTVAQQPATAPAQPERELTVTVDGVTYYDVDAIRNFLTEKYAGQRVGMGSDGVFIGNEQYKVAYYMEGPWSYVDPTPLLDAEVLTPEELSRLAAYGK